MVNSYSSVLIAALLVLGACSQNGGSDRNRQDLVSQHSQELNDWFEARFEDELARSPMLRTELAVGESHANLDDISQTGLDEQAALTESWLTEMQRSFDPARLNASTALSYELYTYDARDDLAMHDIADRTYAFTHMSGPHTGFPSFMVNAHAITSAQHARDYIRRLEAADEFLGGAMQRAQTQAEDGVLLPNFVYPKLAEAARNVITGAPFTEGPDSPLFADFKAKVGALEIAQTKKDELYEAASQALLSDVQPAYLDLLQMFDSHAAVADENDGVWKLPDGEAYYQARLKHYTSTDLTADEIHEIGLKEVADIHAEMEVIKDQVGFDGSLQDFFTHLRTSPEFTYANDADGRARYIKEATAYIDAMKGELDDLFITQPRADVIVKRVEPFREASAFGAFYERPAADGSRPGTYYINLKDMNELPVYQMQALAYHEGIPGHHMQIAIAQELDDIPKFRNYAVHVPYVEGWALYAESVPAEREMYVDPYQDFGRLSMELFRAVRLVVDTGIHAKRWTRQEAVDYMMENSANSEGDIRSEADRYIVWPGQATAYKVGMMKIEELRSSAETRLGDAFNLAEFHDVILANGSVPLPILETLVTDWIEQIEGNGT